MGSGGGGGTPPPKQNFGGYTGPSQSSFTSDLGYDPMKGSNNEFNYGWSTPSTFNDKPYYHDPTIADQTLGFDNWGFSPGAPSAGGGTSDITGYLYGGQQWNPNDAIPIYNQRPTPMMQAPMKQTQLAAQPGVSTGPQTSAGVDQSALANPNAATNTPTPAATPAASTTPANSNATWNPAWGTMPGAASTSTSILGGSSLGAALGK